MACYRSEAVAGREAANGKLRLAAAIVRQRPERQQTQLADTGATRYDVPPLRNWEAVVGTPSLLWTGRRQYIQLAAPGRTVDVGRQCLKILSTQTLKVSNAQANLRQPARC